MTSTHSTTQDSVIESEAGGLWSDVWRRFKHNPIALAGFYV
ncbi:MAG: ABC transporter permease, partial [Deltaproteobacteria bacterium]|nr:ABC transporter permease [Deltaproteobacteria bacterium]